MTPQEDDTADASVSPSGIMKPVRVAVVQYTPQLEARSENIASIEQLVEGLKADLIILPELCTIGYSFHSRSQAAPWCEDSDGPSRAMFRRIAHSTGACVVGGFAEKDGSRQYNSAALVIPGDGEYVYRKTHLFFRERFAFDEGDSGFFVRKDPRRDMSIGMMICYDWRFPESARALGLAGADIIACPSNLVTDVWHISMPSRALENKVYVACANREGTEERNGETLVFKGESALWGYDGTLMAKAPRHGNHIITADVEPARTRDKSFNPFNDIFTDRRPERY